MCCIVNCLTSKVPDIEHNVFAVTASFGGFVSTLVNVLAVLDHLFDKLHHALRHLCERLV